MEKKFLKNAAEQELHLEMLTEKEILEIDGGNRQPGKGKDFFQKLVNVFTGGVIGGPIGAIIGGM